MHEPDPREVVTTKALKVWIAAVAVYMVAILGRTSFGVAGVDAIERFQVDASAIAVFASVQIGVYALCQIPMGLLIDRFGPRAMLVAGALIMATGQIMLGFTSVYWVAIVARVLIGIGDATAFLSAMRILPYWFPLRKTPLITQLTASLGQVGQFLSAVPFLWLLGVSGWTTAFVTLGAVGILVSLAAVVAVKDVPEGSTPDKAEDLAREHVERMSLPSALRAVFTSPVCWLAFFLHWVSMVYVIAFTLMWGMPLMTVGMGLSTALAGSLLVINTIAGVISGPLMGVVSGLAGARRDLVAIAGTILHTAAWVLFFLSDDPRGFIGIVLVAIVMAVATPMSNYGFDSIRETLPHSVVATGTGMANMGGFTAGMLAAQSVGLLLDRSSGGTALEWGNFRFAWLAVFVVWGVGLVGVLVARAGVQAQAKHGSQPVVVVDEQEPERIDDNPEP